VANFLTDEIQEFLDAAFGSVAWDVTGSQHQYRRTPDMYRSLAQPDVQPVSAGVDIRCPDRPTPRGWFRGRIPFDTEQGGGMGSHRFISAYDIFDCDGVGAVCTRLHALASPS
jgi:hypothetical protein